MNILVIDIGGTNVKIWKTGEADKEKFPSGKKLTPQLMVDEVKKLAGDWKFDRVSIGYPGEVEQRPSRRRAVEPGRRLGRLRLRRRLRRAPCGS